MKNLFFLSCLLLVFTACRKDNVDSALLKTKVIYRQSVCCENFTTVASAVDGPENCLPYSLLYATNLEAFAIPQNYAFGDTLTIEYSFAGECEAFYCLIVCNRRHGIPILLHGVE